MIARRIASQAFAPFPRKSRRLLSKFVRGRLPQSFHSPQSSSLTRFTFSTLLVRTLFSTNHAKQPSRVAAKLQLSKFLWNLQKPIGVLFLHTSESFPTQNFAVHVPYIHRFVTHDKQTQKVREERSTVDRSLRKSCRGVVRCGVDPRAGR